jgi:multicomponent Na+:H+ antiporter subunit E
VLDPRLPIAPGIVRIRTELEQPYQRLILANSITLTPGTVTLETEGADLYVHWIDVRETDPETAGETIKGELERAIRRI